jgi:2-keto-4-pentenoate hydratase/2-oxohepta-3-ene-1,7-dioic acid hydratase in catechol pathway
MRFVTVELKGKQVLGIFAADKNFLIPLKEAEKIYCNTQTLPDNMLELIEQGDAALAKTREIISKLDGHQPLLPLNETRVLAPIPRPKKNIFCVGKNYLDHVQELSGDKNFDPAVPSRPVFFSKSPTCVIGHNEIVKHHQPFVSKLDYEVELAVVIGKKAFQINKENAYDHVFGYTIMNDVTARDLQLAHNQWFLGKSPDTFAPLGPCIVHKSELDDPHDLFIKSTINGELRQNSNTKNMIFDIPTLLTTLASVITLEPGDIIATGTPSGVGSGFKPPKFLNPGDEMRLEIEKIGVLINKIENLG